MAIGKIQLGDNIKEVTFPDELLGPMIEGLCSLGGNKYRPLVPNPDYDPTAEEGTSEEFIPNPASKEDHALNEIIEHCIRVTRSYLKKTADSSAQQQFESAMNSYRSQINVQ
jgi:hypothetical protein